MKYRILVVDDEPDIREILCLLLQKEGYETIPAANGKQAVAMTMQEQYDLIILDVMMPEMDGITACRQIRKSCLTPVLFLTAKTQEENQVLAYTSGGDDFLGKPFSQQNLLLRVSSLIRRYRNYNAGTIEPVLPADWLRLNEKRRSVTMEDGEEIQLTDKEYDILQFFLEHRGEAVDTKTIYEVVWKERFLIASNNTVMVHILNLRRKLERDPGKPTLIRTVWGKGYQID